MTKADDAPEAQTLEDLICFAHYAATLNFQRLYRPLLAELGLTYPQFLAMMVLWETEKVTMRDLADRLQLESNTLTPLVKKLEQAGLALRTRNRRDERVLDIALTDKGRALESYGRAIARSVAAASGESVTERHAIVRRINRMRDSLKAAAKPEL